MYYEFAIANAANTAEASANETQCELDTGVLYRVEIQFPHGCDGLAHCRILQGGVPLFPSNLSGSFASSGHALIIDEEYELTEGRTVFTVQSWNTDDTFAHTIYIRFGILRGEASLWFIKLLRGIEKMLKLVGIRV